MSNLNLLISLKPSKKFVVVVGGCGVVVVVWWWLRGTLVWNFGLSQAEKYQISFNLYCKGSFEVDTLSSAISQIKSLELQINKDTGSFWHIFWNYVMLWVWHRVPVWIFGYKWGEGAGLSWLINNWMVL